ncbi:MAG: hypothetical protein HOG03_10610 [Desulfobacula sp.]|jgi:hypothetical protein|uniref:hypothetical protein n=1 Tax=Desulfobacula sp. TaxID=2593537 RepID=UPI001D927D04|nr:hypothetical protein [Desulfobacula sp.]MBT3484312.1 hypothetical protein [Desulfobacula sp.]MBT3805037.1 hypothetical protein [Desulfobacula sp.]MBT4024121.1 hypothetical protein [Desulfobacula sp.]MBT4197445.1 hypothetical protein [Desulfobacula sp.]
MVQQYSLEEIRNALGISYSAVSKSVASIKAAFERDKVLKKDYEILNSQFKM